MLTFDYYQKEMIKTAIYDKQYAVVYPLLGATGELGEIANKYQKVLRDNKGILSPEVKKEILKEIGDTLWFLTALTQDLGYTIQEVAKENLSKLESRHARGKIGGSGDNR